MRKPKLAELLLLGLGCEEDVMARFRMRLAGGLPLMAALCAKAKQVFELNFLLYCLLARLPKRQPHAESKCYGFGQTLA